MKLTTLLFLAGLLQVSATVYSQSTKFNFNAENRQIVDVLREIEENSNFRFFYIREQVDVEREVSFNANNATVEEILDQIFEGENIGYKVMEDFLILLSPGNSAIEMESISQQQKSISGSVTNESGQSLPGVTVVVKGTTHGTTTDADGSYSLSNVSGDATLVFSFVGMRTQEITVDGKSLINVVLVEETIGIEEIVAVGYGTQKKATVTGSISSVDGNALKQSPASSMSNSLSGRLPGVVTLNRSGEPGYDDATILIRGANTLGDNSPLVVVDGVPHRDLNRLDPKEIESITVLKDASAAIYGAQAANGVILVTTHRGKSGKPTVEFDINQGFNQPTRIPETADAAQYATMLNEVYTYQSKPLRYTADEIQKFRAGTDPWLYPNDNWADEVIKPYSYQSYYNASISGGNDNFKYFVNIGTRYEDGYFFNSAADYNQYNFRSNLDGKVTDNISISFDIAGRQENRNSPRGDVANIFQKIILNKHSDPAFWPNGLPAPGNPPGSNQAVICTDASGYFKDDRYVLNSNLKLKIDIPWIDGLSFTGNIAVDKRFTYTKEFGKPWYLYSWDQESYENGEPALVGGKFGLSEPYLTQEDYRTDKLLLNGILNYETKILSDHKLNILIGAERQKGEGSVLSAYRRYFISDEIDQMFAGGDKDKTNGGYAWLNARLNYFGRINYNVKDKYLAEFVWRYDGSYIFPKDKRFGFFPGVSLGWRISEEDFWKESLPGINHFKLRGSWGQTGNDRIDEYQYLSSYGFSDKLQIFGVTEEMKILNELRIPNKDVTWEVATQSNIGIEGQALDSKLAFEFDYFYNKRSNILWWRNASIPASTGLTLPRENIGKVTNKGIDFLVRYGDNSHEFKYNISINGSYAKNKITFWDESPGVDEWQKSTGHPMETDLYYLTDGVFNDEAELNSRPHWPGARTGDLVFVDYNKDGAIDALDRVRLDKNEIPRFTGGLSFNASYKNFDFAVLFQGAAGAVRYVKILSGELGNYLKDYADKRWTLDNPDSEHPRSYNREDEYWTSNNNDYFLRNTDYLRLKSLEFGYSVPTGEKMKSAGIKGIRVYVNGLNLLTIDKLKIFDPESTSIDGSFYPQRRVVNTGLTITF